jgi:hypothetical protein
LLVVEEEVLSFPMCLKKVLVVDLVDLLVVQVMVDHGQVDLELLLNPTVVVVAVVLFVLVTLMVSNVLVAMVDLV